MCLNHWLDDDFDDIENEDAVTPSPTQGKVPVSATLPHQSVQLSNIRGQAKASRTSGEELKLKKHIIYI